jgi:hypothetical protein
MERRRHCRCRGGELRRTVALLRRARPRNREQRRTHVAPSERWRSGGTMSSNLLCSSSQSVSVVHFRAGAKSPALWRRSAGGWGREKGRAGCERGLLRPFSLTGIDAVPPPEGSDRLQKTRGRGGAAACGISVRSCGLACEQFVLLRPVQRQIEFGQPRRGERDGLPAL